MSKSRVILGILVVFLLGMAAGSLVTFGFIGHRLRHGLPGTSPPGTEFITQQMAHRLALDATQQKQVRIIIEETRRQFERLRAEMIGPETTRILHESDQRIRTLLRPDQMRRFDMMIAERHPLPPHGPPSAMPPR